MARRRMQDGSRCNLVYLSGTRDKEKLGQGRVGEAAKVEARHTKTTGRSLISLVVESIYW